MHFGEWFNITLYWIWFGLTALGIGHFILSWLRWKGSTSSTLALSYYLGFMTLGYGWVTLGLFGYFHTWTILLLLGTSSVPALFGLRSLLPRSGRATVQMMRNTKQTSWWLLLVLIVGISISIANFFAAFAPPTARDAISYHIPEANNVIANHQLIFPLGGHPFYGNIPVFMETVYAAGINVAGYSLAQLFHYSLYLAFLLFIFGWLRQHYQLRTAVWGLVAVQLLHDVTTTAISLNIDSAHLVLEVIGTLLVIDWIVKPQSAQLRMAGAILGLALAMKYSPLATISLLSIAILGTMVTRRYTVKKAASTLLHFIVPLLVVCGFWYLKNAITLHNPLYPLYFGHAGYDPVQFESLMAAIQDYRIPRTFMNWIIFPYHFYWRGPGIASLLAIPQANVVLLAWLILPFAFLLRPHLRQFLLASYVVAYGAYWFFIGTHQIRFLDSANLVLVLCAVITLSHIPKRWWWGLSLTIVTVCMIGLAWTKMVRTVGNLAWVSVRTNVIHWPEVSYALGLRNKAEYLQDYLDCGYNVAYYLETNQLPGTVLDNWSVWHNSQFGFYVTNNVYDRLLPDLDNTTVNEFIAQHGVRYIYFNQESKADFPATGGVTEQAYYYSRVNQENTLLENAKLIYSYDTCQLYELPQ